MWSLAGFCVLIWPAAVSKKGVGIKARAFMYGGVWGDSWPVLVSPSRNGILNW